MFDEDGSGELGEDELAFALEYLNLDVSGQKQEYFMRKYDADGSGALEYPEFRKMWLFCCNPRTELTARGIKFSRFDRRAGLRVVLEKAVLAEEALEYGAERPIGLSEDEADALEAAARAGRSGTSGGASAAAARG